jgi:hypothetical protein
MLILILILALLSVILTVALKTQYFSIRAKKDLILFTTNLVTKIL